MQTLSRQPGAPRACRHRPLAGYPRSSRLIRVVQNESISKYDEYDLGICGLRLRGPHRFHHYFSASRAAARKIWHVGDWTREHSASRAPSCACTANAGQGCKKRKRGIRSLVSWRQLLVPLHDSSQRLQTHFHQSRVLFISNGFGQFWNVGLVQCGAVLGNVHEHGLRIVGR